MIPRRYMFTISILVLLSVGMGLLFWPFLPSFAPIRWDLHDHASSYAPRWIAAMIFPAINLLTVGVALLAPRWRPFNRRVVKMGRVYGLICMSTILAMVCIQLICMLVDIGVDLKVGQMTLLVVGLLIAVMGNFMGKVRRNWFFGIRTPWTLANDTVWERTHRIGSVLFFCLGLLIVLTSLFTSVAIAAIALTAGLLLITAWALVYSAVLYHHVVGVGHPRN